MHKPQIASYCTNFPDFGYSLEACLSYGTTTAVIIKQLRVEEKQKSQDFKALTAALDLNDAYNRIEFHILLDQVIGIGISVTNSRWVLTGIIIRSCIMKHRMFQLNRIIINTSLS